MEKKVLVTIVAVVVVLALVFAVYNFTGQAVLGECIDSDADSEHPDGDNPEVKGTATYSNRDIEYEDYCVRKGVLNEYYCHGVRVAVREVHCDNNVCTYGACTETR